MTRRLANWRRAPSLLSAAELVETAIVDGREPVAVHAARRILFIDRSATASVKEQAALLLRRAGHNDEIPDQLTADQRPTIRLWRGRVRQNPRDPLAWVELALCQTIQGHSTQAERSMQVALQLAPDNRHVLRSASRLFLHLGDPARAHDVILRSSASKSDPWLISAEITFAELASRQPRTFKQGVRIVEDSGLRPHQLTELTGAIATAELVAGKQKKARKLFASSLADPTGNSLAQAEWASPIVGVEMVTAARLGSVAEASEANAFHSYREGDFDAVPEACEEWAETEPYSIRPYEFGASAAGLVEKYERAAELARRGLMMRPGAPRLVNSLVFALASMGRLTEAESALRTASSLGASQLDSNITKANRGLIHARRGEIEAAKEAYLSAIDGFHKAALYNAEASAKIYFAREAVLANIPEASELIADARKSWSKQGHSRPHPALFRTEQLAKAANIEVKAPSAPIPKLGQPLSTRHRPKAPKISR